MREVFVEIQRQRTKFEDNSEVMRECNAVPRFADYNYSGNVEYNEIATDVGGDMSKSEDRTRERTIISDCFHSSNASMCDNDSPHTSQQHEFERSKSNKLFYCRFCRQEFEYLSNMQIHQQSHLDKDLICKYCQKMFKTFSSLVTHQRIHTGERPYKCKICNRSFSVRGNLQRHEQLHTGVRPYKCKFCHKSFFQSNNLRRHERIHFANR